MVAYINTVAFAGVETTSVEVQSHMSAGIPAFTIVGLPDKAVAESRERVRVAIQSLGLAMPAKRITINLAPADLAKEGSHYDLPIALALLTIMGVLPQEELSEYLALGELSLDGRIQQVSGVLPTAMAAIALGKGLICPEANANEAIWAGDMNILPASSLLAIIKHFKGEQILKTPELKHAQPQSHRVDLAQIKGHLHAKRAMEIAAAGGHNLLMVGPPGTGKSMLASSMPSILPPMSAKEMLDVSVIASIAGNLPDNGLVQMRPFRAPHHSASLPAMVGGGKRAYPGEISLAHRGVLFLDELPEFPRPVLEALRQPLETRNISISRVQAHITYPAHFQLIAAMNPCRCGYLGDVDRSCSKAPRCGEDYQNKLSGPLLDRFDMKVMMPMLKSSELFSDAPIETSAQVLQRVEAARIKQYNRYGEGVTNAEASKDLLEQTFKWDDNAVALLREATEQMRLSMRGITRISRVAATITDLAGRTAINRHAIAEALSYRQQVGEMVN
jgi:magnesium chelatase family protein